MTEQRCIYGQKHGRNYSEECERLDADSIDSKSKELIRRWYDHLFATGTKELRVVKLSGQVRRITADLSVPLAEVRKADAERLIAGYNRRREWSEATKADYRRALKQFYAWYQDCDPRTQRGGKDGQEFYLYLKKHVRASCKDRQFDYSEILTQEDLEALLERGAATVKERAFLALLHEGGFRAAEILNIRIKDLRLRDVGYVVSVDGKTGRRQTPLVWSWGYVAQWLGLHPDRDNQEAYLWLIENQNPKLRGLPMGHRGAQKLVDRCMKRAGLRKKKNMHWFRHSRATINARFMTESVLCRFFGWSPGSRMVRKYVHMNVEQVEAAVLEMNGVASAKEEAAKPIKCSCGLMNQSNARYCLQCGRPLSVGVMFEDEKEKRLSVDDAFAELAQILSDPKRRAAFEAFSQRRAS